MYCSTGKVGRGHCPQHVSRARGNTALQNTDSTYVQHSHIITVAVLGSTARTNIIWLAPFPILKTEPVEFGVWMHNLLFTPFCVCLFSAFITFWLHIFHFALFICLFFPLFHASFKCLLPLSVLFSVSAPSVLSRVRMQEAITSFVMFIRLSVCTYGTPRTKLGGFSWNFVQEYFFKNLSRRINFHENPTRITGTIYQALCTFMTISSSILLTMWNISDKLCRENKNTFYVQKPFPQSLIVYEITWKSTVKSDRPQMTT